MQRLIDARLQVGPHNVYDIYDNCAQTAEWLRRSGKDMRWLIQYLRSKVPCCLHNSHHAACGCHCAPLPPQPPIPPDYCSILNVTFTCDTYRRSPLALLFAPSADRRGHTRTNAHDIPPLVPHR